MCIASDTLLAVNVSAAVSSHPSGSLQNPGPRRSLPSLCPRRETIVLTRGVHLFYGSYLGPILVLLLHYREELR